MFIEVILTAVKASNIYIRAVCVRFTRGNCNSVNIFLWKAAQAVSIHIMVSVDSNFQLLPQSLDLFYFAIPGHNSLFEAIYVQHWLHLCGCCLAVKWISSHHLIPVSPHRNLCILLHWVHPHEPCGPAAEKLPQRKDVSTFHDGGDINYVCLLMCSAVRPPNTAFIILVKNLVLVLSGYKTFLCVLCPKTALERHPGSIWPC